MKKILSIALAVMVMAAASPSHAFLDYLFGGSHTRDAIDNNAVGDLRAWWTGNPAYTFNPYYNAQNPLTTNAPGQPDQNQGGPAPYSMGNPQELSPQQSGQPSVSYYPPQQYQQAPQQYQGAPAGYAPQQQVQQYQAAPQQYQYQQAPQQYQAAPQQYQGAPAGYAPQQQVQQYQAAPQQYQYQQAPQQYQAAPQQYQGAPQAGYGYQ